MKMYVKKLTEVWTHGEQTSHRLPQIKSHH